MVNGSDILFFQNNYANSFSTLSVFSFQLSIIQLSIIQLSIIQLSIIQLSIILSPSLF